MNKVHHLAVSAWLFGFVRSIAFALCALLASPVLATPSKPLAYGGRMVDSTGKPLAGPVDLTFSFHPTATGASTLGSPVLRDGVPLFDGVFQITLDLEDDDLHTIFSEVSAPVWVQVTDRTNTKTYPRQRFTVIPYALKVPVDGLTVDFDDEGLLHVGPTLPAGLGQFLTSDGSGKLIWDTPAGGGGGATVEDAINNSEILKAPSENAVFDALALRDTALAGKEPTITSGTTAQYLRGDKSWQTVVTDVVADGVTAVAPSQNAVFDALAAKEGAIIAGTTAEYLRGDKTWQTLNTTNVAEGTNLYFTNGRAKAAAVADSLADGVADVASSQNAVFDAFSSRDVTIAGKEPAFGAGTIAQYLRGDKTWATLNTTTVTEAGGLYFTNARAQGAAVADAIVDATINVAPSQNAVFDALTLKQNDLGAGTTAQYLRGDRSWQTLDTTNVAEGTNQYFTTGRAKSAAVADGIVDATTDVAPSQNAVFDALALKQNLTAKNAANGYAGLDASGKILPGNLPYAGLAFKGTWDAGTNTPTLTSGACGASGDYYITAAGGATTLNGISTWGLGDWAICGTGSAWTRVGNPSGSGITTINGLTGTTVTMVTDDVNEGSTNQYFTAARAKTAAVADALSNGTTDVAPSQNAVFDALALKEGSVTAGTTAQYFRGDKTWATLNTTNVAEGTGLYFTNARAQSAAVADAVVDATTNVAPSQNAVFDALATKEGSITAGTTAQYFRGDKTWQTLSTTNVTEGTNLFFTTARAKSAAVADALADGVTDVAPSQNAVFDTVATINTTISGKEPAITGGTSGQFWRGDKTWQAVVADAINDGTTTVAPSQNAVFDALALKAPTTHAHASLDASDGLPTQALAVDAAGNVGIGTTSPNAKLDVAGNIVASGGSRSILLGNSQGMVDAGGAELTLKTAMTTPIVLSPNNVEAMRIASGGNVGIGTTNPQNVLDLGQTTMGRSLTWAGTDNIGTWYSGSGIGILAGLTLDSTSQQLLYSYATIGRAGIRVGGGAGVGGDISFFNAPSSTQTVGAVFDHAANTKMVVKESGNVGIGTVAPDEALTVSGDVKILSANRLHFSNTSDRSYISAPVSDTLAFSTSAAEAMRITSAGNVGIGTTVPNLTGYATTYGVESVAGSTGGALELTSATDADNQILGDLGFVSSTQTVATSKRAAMIRSVLSGSTANNRGSAMSFWTRADGGANSVAERVRIDSGGNVGIGTTIPTNRLEVVNSTAGIGAIQGINSATTGTNYGLVTAASGSGATSNVGIYAYAIGATSNTSLRIPVPVAGANNYAIYSDATAQSYFGGNVGVGTTSPRSALDVVGTLLAPAAPSNAAPTTTAVNFLTGNQQWTSANCALGFKLHHMKDGGMYTLGVKGTTSGTCSFNAYSDAGTTALTVHLPSDHAATTVSKHTIYSFLVLGTDVYVAWIPGY